MVNGCIDHIEQWSSATDADPEYLVVFLHGYGANGQDLIALAGDVATALPPSIFIAPNAPDECEMAPMGYQWFSLEQYDPDIMLQGIESAAEGLHDFLDAALEEYGLDESRLILIGFSQGTMMALHVALRRAESCCAVVGFSGRLLGEHLLNDEQTSFPPVFLAHGDMDSVVPFESMGMASAVLSVHNVPVETHVSVGVGHSIDASGLQKALAFLQQHTSASIIDQ